MSIAGSSSIRRLKDVAVVVGLHEFAPVGRRASGGRDGQRLERFAEVCQDLPDRPLVGDERDQPDVTVTTRALQRKLLPHPRHELGPRNPRRVVRARLLIRVTAASRGVVVARMSARRGIAPLADIPNDECGDGFSQSVIRREHPWLVSRR